MIKRLVKSSKHFPGICILHVEFPQFLFSIYVWRIKGVYTASANIVAAIAEVTCAATLVQSLTNDPDAFFSCCIFNKQRFHGRNHLSFLDNIQTLQKYSISHRSNVFSNHITRSYRLRSLWIYTTLKPGQACYPRGPRLRSLWIYTTLKQELVIVVPPHCLRSLWIYTTLKHQPRTLIHARV